MPIRLDLLGHLDPAEFPFALLSAAWDSHAAFVSLNNSGQLQSLEGIDQQILALRYCVSVQTLSRRLASLPDYYSHEFQSVLLLREFRAGIRQDLSDLEASTVCKELFLSTNSLEIATMVATSAIVTEYMDNRFKELLSSSVMASKQLVRHLCKENCFDEIGWLSRLAVGPI